MAHLAAAAAEEVFDELSTPVLSVPSLSIGMVLVVEHRIRE